jgi:hypothetical protein
MLPAQNLVLFFSNASREIKKISFIVVAPTCFDSTKNDVFTYFSLQYLIVTGVTEDRIYFEDKPILGRDLNQLLIDEFNKFAKFGILNDFKLVSLFTDSFELLNMQQIKTIYGQDINIVLR